MQFSQSDLENGSYELAAAMFFADFCAGCRPAGKGRRICLDLCVNQIETKKEQIRMFSEVVRVLNSRKSRHYVK